MTRAEINQTCAALPGAAWSESFGPGHDVWKVGDKMFAMMGTRDDGISLKTPDVETAQMLIETGTGEKAPYLHRSWVRLPPGAPDDELRHRIGASYDIVRSSLTKKARSALPPRKDT